MLDQPGHFTYRDGVAIIQLVPFLLFLGLAIVLCIRHGFRRTDGWVVVVVFSLLRIIGACFQLASINNPTASVYGGALICQGIGIAPLTLLNLGLFFRLNKFVPLVHQKLFAAISILSFVGIGLSIYGGNQSATSPTLDTNPYLKASILIFVACYLIFAGLFLLFLKQWHTIPAAEHKLLVCFACAAPLMVVRFVFSIIGTFVKSLRPQFSVLTGDVTTYLCMAVLEEIAVVALYVYTGMRLERLSPEMRGKVQQYENVQQYGEDSSKVYGGSEEGVGRV